MTFREKRKAQRIKEFKKLLDFGLGQKQVAYKTGLAISTVQKFISAYMPEYRQQGKIRLNLENKKLFDKND